MRRMERWHVPGRACRSHVPCVSGPDGTHMGPHRAVSPLPWLLEHLELVLLSPWAPGLSERSSVPPTRGFASPGPARQVWPLCSRGLGGCWDTLRFPARGEQESWLDAR